MIEDLNDAKSWGGKYVEFNTPSSPAKGVVYGRRPLAKAKHTGDGVA